MKEWTRRLAVLAFLFVLLLPAKAALRIEPQTGEANGYGINIPFTPSPRTKRYLFEVYDGASAEGEAIFVGKEALIGSPGAQEIFLPLAFDLSGPHTYTLKVTALPMPGREGLDTAASQVKTFQTGLHSTCGHSTSAGGYLFGTGTAADPYRVASAKQLDHVRQHLSSNFLQIDHINVGEAFPEWTPISIFSGSYNGDGWAIQNVNSLTVTVSGRNANGLFGVCESAALRGICLYNFRSLSYSSGEAGPILAQARYNTLIQQCCVHGATVWGRLAGGLLGVDYDVGNITPKTNVQNCYSEMVTVKSQETNSSSYAAGGLMGSRNSAGTINYCYSVPANVICGYAGQRGGLVGYNGSNVSNSFFLSNSAWNRGGGTPKTEAELKTAATYAGWDTNIWDIRDGSYPALKIERTLS